MSGKRHEIHRKWARLPVALKAAIFGPIVAGLVALLAWLAQQEYPNIVGRNIVGRVEITEPKYKYVEQDRLTELVFTCSLVKGKYAHIDAIDVSVDSAQCLNILGIMKMATGVIREKIELPFKGAFPSVYLHPVEQYLSSDNGQSMSLAFHLNILPDKAFYEYLKSKHQDSDFSAVLSLSVSVIYNGKEQTPSYKILHFVENGPYIYLSYYPLPDKRMSRLNDENMHVLKGIRINDYDAIHPRLEWLIEANNKWNKER